MTFRVANRVKITASAPGTAAFPATAAITGFIGFNNIPSVANGDIIPYTAWDGGANWEVGFATYNSTGPVLTRSIVTQNSAGTFVPINFSSGIVTIFCDAPASMIGAVPTSQTLTATTSSTYTPTNNRVTKIFVEGVGGGGGGAGATANGGTVSGADGTKSTFNGVDAAPGGGGSSSSNGGGIGGTGGSGTANQRIPGNGGGSGVEGLSAGFVSNPQRGLGGASMFGGVHYSTTSGVGENAAANTGSGGNGAISGTGPTNYQTAGGGGGAEGIKLWLPAGLYTYQCGVGGTGGASSVNGGNGANGRFEVTEFYD